MEATRAEAEAALKKLGGIKDDSAHCNYKIVVDGMTIGKASISHSWRKLDTYRLGRVAVQIKLSARQFYELIHGEKDLAWYREHLKEKGYL